MKILNKIYDFAEKHIKPIRIISTCVLSIAFVGTVCLSVFSGGEFNQTEEVEEARGLISIVDADYRTSYISGDKFQFNKETAKVQLFAKDPLIEDVVLIDELPSSEYGFQVNGTGDIIDNPSDIVLTKEVTSIDVVSVVYTHIKTSIDVVVMNELDTTKLTNSILYEAENANIYKAGQLLTEEQLKTEPNTEKPYLSNEGSVVDGTSCSGGACLRNFQSTNMRVEFIIASSVETEATFTIGCCLRKEVATLGDWYKVTVNDETVADAESQSIPMGTGYFEPHTLNAIKIKLARGINYINFVSGSSAGTSSPGNLDFIKLEASENVLGTMDAIKE